MASLLAVALAVLAVSSVPAPEPAGPPGSETYGKEFCERSPLPTDDPSPPAGLAVERGSVAPGKAAFARVEVRSARGVEFGTPYDVQRYANGRWRDAPGGPRGSWVAIGLGLAEYESGYCMRYVVPDNAPLGRYRFTRALAVGESRGRPFYATFRVLPSEPFALCQPQVDKGRTDRREGAQA